jgi:large subunit ribosomal protein L32
MAVPKKRTSKMKTRLRKAQWKAQANLEATKALSKAKTIIKALLVEKSVISNPKTEE